MRIGVATLACLLFAAPWTVAGSDNLSFALASIPDFGGEPNLEVAPDGTVFIVYPDGSGSRLWRRTPGGAFEDLGRPNLGFGGADEDVAVGPDGLVAIAGMYYESGLTRRGPCSSVTVSRDGGDTWLAPVAGVCAEAAVDRPYLVIDASGAFWLLQHAYCCLGQHSVHYSRDGVTFAPVGAASAIGGFPGNLFISGDRIFAASKCGTAAHVGGMRVGVVLLGDVTVPSAGAQMDAVCMSWSATAAPQPAWTPTNPVRVPSGLIGLGHSTGAIDDAGNLYLAWSEAGETGSHVAIARSTTAGATWTPRERLSGGNAATFPWIVAGAEGRVAVAWYEADVPGDPNQVPADALWNVHLAVRSSWGAPWERMIVSVDRPNHVGPLCTNGFACGAQRIDRDLLDYFELTLGPDGRLHLAWSDDVSWRVRYAEQVSGTRLR